MDRQIERIILIVLGIVFFETSYSQNHKISFGLNVIHFSDWEEKPLYFFNPEIRYAKSINENSAIDAGLNVFYGEAKTQDFQNTGDVYQRLIFSTDITFKGYWKKISADIGPTFRYRNEKIIASCPYCPLWEFRTEPQRSFFDFGGIAGLNYEFLVKRSFSFELRIAYRVYNNGQSPISFGLFYNKKL